MPRQRPRGRNDKATSVGASTDAADRVHGAVDLGVPHRHRGTHHGCETRKQPVHVRLASGCPGVRASGPAWAVRFDPANGYAPPVRVAES